MAQDLREAVKPDEQTLALRPQVPELGALIGRIHAADQRVIE